MLRCCSTDWTGPDRRDRQKQIGISFVRLVSKVRLVCAKITIGVPTTKERHDSGIFCVGTVLVREAWRADYWMAPELLESERSYSIIGAFLEVFHYFGPGLPEIIYSKALESELRDRGHKVVREFAVEILYKELRIGRKRLDMVVDDRIVVELKATEKLTEYSELQIKTYLKVSEFEVGLLLHAGPIANWKRFIDSPKRQHRRAPLAIAAP